MALKGNLRDFPVIQLLNLINLARKSGRLVLEGAGETAWAAFREGRLAWAQFGNEDGSLAAVLRRSHKITKNQYRLLKEKTAQMSDKELGLLLINAGYTTQADILACLQQHYTQVVRRLFTWVEGAFHFEPGAAPPEERIAVRVNLENLIIEGVRQTQEWEQLQDEIPSLDIALKFSERPGTSIHNIHLSAEEWRVVSYVNPKNTLRQIARVVQMSDFEIRRLVYGLLQAGIVELVRAEQAAVPMGQTFSTTNKEAQRSLVDRLINRIRSI